MNGKLTVKEKSRPYSGWLDCGCGDDLVTRPFASGTFYWSEFVNGINTPASLEFNLNAP